MKIISILVLLVCVVVPLILKSGPLANSLQEVFVNNRGNLEASLWGKPWIRTLFKIVIIFFGIVISGIIFSLFWGPVSIK